MNKRTQFGFTIIELMAVVLIASILIMVAIPSFTSFVINNRMTTEANSLVTSLQVARSEAVKRNSSVYVGSTSGNGNWGQGFVIFLDVNGNGAYNASDTILRQQNALPSDLLNASIGGTATAVLQYLPTGFTGNLGAGILTFDLCHQANYQGRQITVNSVGQVTLNDSCTCNSSNQCN